MPPSSSSILNTRRWSPILPFFGLFFLYFLSFVLHNARSSSHARGTSGHWVVHRLVQVHRHKDNPRPVTLKGLRAYAMLQETFRGPRRPEIRCHECRLSFLNSKQEKKGSSSRRHVRPQENSQREIG